MIRPTQALIDRAAIVNNIRVIRSTIRPGTRIMAAVKADCYGHGLEICLPTLVEAGVEMFGVATVEEGAQLRRLGARNRIIVLSPPVEGQMGEFAMFDLEAMISNRRMAEHLSRATQPGRTVAVHTFVDTGMGRDGARPEDVLELLRVLDGLDNLAIRGLASHFATSDEIDNSFASEQLSLFERLRQETTGAGFSFEDVHIANSGGVFNLPDSHYTLVRPGLAVYGYHPTAERQRGSGLEPVMTLRTEIANITRMPAGHPISYGRRYYTTAETSIATIPIGYGDGLMRSLTNRAGVLVGGRRFPLVGTICMDEVMIDLGSDHGVSVGDEAILIGRSGDERIDAWELAGAIGTIPYEISTNISARVARVPTNEHP